MVPCDLPNHRLLAYMRKVGRSYICRLCVGNTTKWKYFQHAGALLTADGSDDELIKFEGVPADYKLSVPRPA